MKIVADEHIPLLKNYFPDDELILKSGREIAKKDLMDADVLLIRSVTKVNQALLENTAVKFVGSTTSGADHLDTEWLDAQNIKWSVASGCNAMAVAEYVICVIAALQKKDFLLTEKIRAAVVGVGKIGELVAQKFKLLGFDVVLCDPFRKDIVTTSFDKLTDLDFISFHTPLTKSGAYPTYHMAQKKFLQKQKQNCILLNAGRGEVFSFADLKQYGKDLIWCLDVWENEPYIDREMLQEADMATPHIAGYSLQSKYRGIEMIYQKAVQLNIIKKRASYKMVYPTQKIKINSVRDWRDVVLNIFDPVSLTVEMKEKILKGKNNFDEIRKKCVDRYEFGFVELENNDLREADNLLLKELGVPIK